MAIDPKIVWLICPLVLRIKHDAESTAVMFAHFGWNAHDERNQGDRSDDDEDHPSKGDQIP